MNVEKKILASSDGDRQLEYTHIQTGSPFVCFMLAGSSYTYDKPLFYYSTMLMLELNIDVVHIHYSYEKDILRSKGMEYVKEHMNADLQWVWNDVIQNGNYRESMFIGKSLGTIPLVHWLENHREALKQRVVLLTPLIGDDTFFEEMAHDAENTLVVIGDKDSHYDEHKIRKLRYCGYNVNVINNATHQLDIITEGKLDTLRSMDEVSNVIQQIREFTESVIHKQAETK